jgi:excisionase family DNA binding protein
MSMSDTESQMSITMPDEGPLLTPDEIARDLRASARTVRRWISLGILPALRVRRRWLVRRRDAMALLRSS